MGNAGFISSTVSPTNYLTDGGLSRIPFWELYLAMLTPTPTYNLEIPVRAPCVVSPRIFESERDLEELDSGPGLRLQGVYRV